MQTFLVEMTFYYHANRTHFHNKGFAPGLVLKVRAFGTLKSPIVCILFSLIMNSLYFKLAERQYSSFFKKILTT